MDKEISKYVEKMWGEEIWLVNCSGYCGKLLLLNKNAKSSYHLHKIKKESFFSIEGYATLIVEGKEYLLAPFTRVKTIYPGEKHGFVGITNAIILEVSTHHDDNDIERFTESEAGKEDSGLNE